MHLTQGATVDGEILGKGKHFAAVDGSVTGDHAVAWNDVLVHVKVPTAVFNQRINLLKTTVVKEEFKAFSCGHFAAIVLGLDTSLAATGFAACFPVSQVLEPLFGARHQLPRGVVSPSRPYCLLFVKIRSTGSRC